MTQSISLPRRVFLAFVLVMCWTSHLAAWQSATELQQVEAQIKQVIAAGSPATVVVTDGHGSGSGVVVSADGLVLTAGHVVATGRINFQITFPDGRQVQARTLGKNLNVDAGMLKIVDPGPWPHVEMGSCDGLTMGDWVVCLGHPGGYDLGRDPPARAGKLIAFRSTQLITDCALIGGDSGGPLFDLAGRLIAIHSSISYDSVAINRHIKIDTFRQHWDRLLAGQTWGQLPELTNEDDELLRARAGLGVTLDLNQRPAVIERVKPGSVAESHGIIAGDQIIEFDGTAIDAPDQLIELVKTKDPGDEVCIEFLRDVDKRRITLRLEQIEP